VTVLEDEGHEAECRADGEEETGDGFDRYRSERKTSISSTNARTTISTSMTGNAELSLFETSMLRAVVPVTRTAMPPEAKRAGTSAAGSISVSVGLDESRRISDQDREQAVLSLRDDLLAGRLTLDEFSERVEIAYRARIGQDLVRVRHDLPELGSTTVGSGRRQKRLTIAFFGSVIRRGRLRLRRRTLVISAFGDVDLDLREAEMHDPRVAVKIFVACGNVDLYVPEGINVEVSGTIIFGRLREWGRDVVRADTPTVSVRSLGCIGTVDVWRVPHGMRGSYSEIFGQLETQQRQLPA
jgi:hypothetical protein